jgi:hypothetical protein
VSRIVAFVVKNIDKLIFCMFHWQTWFFKCRNVNCFYWNTNCLAVILFYLTKNFKKEKKSSKTDFQIKVKLCCLFEFDRMSFTSPFLHPCLSKWSPRQKQIFTKNFLLHNLCFFRLNIHTNKIISIVPMKNSQTISLNID